MSPLLVPLEAELHLSHSQATGLLLLLSAGFSVSMALSSFISRILAHRTIAGLSAVIGGIALLLFLHVETLLQVRIAILCFGLAAGLYFPSGMATLASLVSRKDWGKAIAIHELAPNISFIVAPLVASYALSFTSWRWALAAVGCSSILLGLLFIIIGRGGAKQHTAGTSPSIRGLLANPRIWLFVLIIGLSIGGEYAPFSVLPLYLVNEKGMDFDTTNGILSLSRLACPAVVLIAGFVADKLGTRTAVKLYFITHGIVLIGVGLTSGSLLTINIVLQALLTAFVFPAAFKLMAEAFEPEQQAAAMSLIMPMSAVVGTGIAPALLGLTGDMGSFSSGFVIMALLNFITLIPLMMIRSDRNIRKEA